MEPLPPSSSCTLKCIMDMDGQPSQTAVNKGVTNSDAIPSDFQDAPVIQPPLSDHQQVASHYFQQDNHCQQLLQAFWSGQLAEIQDAPVIQPPLSDHHQVASHYSQQDNHCQQLLQVFWSGQLAEIKQTTELNTHSLPLARINAIPSDFQVAPVIQPPLSDHHQVVSHCSQQDNHCQQPIQAFWSGQLAEIKQTTEFKTHSSLPLARIKKIMKADSNVPRVSGDAPLIFAKACEMFIQELTLRAWLHTEEDKRKTLQKKDVTAALASTEVFDFLVANNNKPKGNGVGLPPPMPTTAKDDDSYGDYYCDDYSPPWSPEPPRLDLRNVTCDDPRYYTYIHDYYSL